MDENLVTTAFLKIKEKWSTLCTMRPYTFLLRASFKGGPPLKEAEKMFWFVNSEKGVFYEKK